MRVVIKKTYCVVVLLLPLRLHYNKAPWSPVETNQQVDTKQIRSEILSRYGREQAVLSPTLALCLFCITGFSVVNYIAASVHPVLGLFNVIFLYYIFTAVHEAVHNTASRIRMINEAIGQVSAFLLLFPFKTFRYFHFLHHKHANSVAEDPDVWSKQRPYFLRALTQSFYYHYLYVKRFAHLNQHQRNEYIGSILLTLLVVGLLFSLGASWILFSWVLSAFLAGGFIAFALVHLPHQDYSEVKEEFLVANIRPGKLPTLLLCCHNYHLIHHLYPSIPFYRYSRVWEQYQPFFKQHRVRIV